MNTEQIHYFLDAVETQSLHKAAERHNISPQGISKALSNLETELGVNLLDRSHKGVFLTAHGQYLYEYFQKMRELNAQVKDYCNKVKQITAAENIKGDVHLVITNRFADSFFNTLINKFKKKYPKINFYLESMDNYHSASSVCQDNPYNTIGIISIVSTNRKELFNFENYCQNNGLHLVYFYNKPLYLCGTKETIKNIDYNVLLGCEKDETAQPTIGYKYGEDYVANTRYQINSITAIKNMMDFQGAYGAFTIDEINIHFNPKNYAYCAPKYELTLRYGYTYKKELPLSYAEEAFLRFLVDYFAEENRS